MNPAQDAIIPHVTEANLLEILEYWVKRQGDKPLYVFFDSHGDLVEQVDYRQFADEVERLAAYFQTHLKASPGARILISCQPGLDGIRALFACNKAGFIGVMTLPLASHQWSAWVNSINHILDDCQAVGLVLCDSSQKILDACLTDGPEDSESFSRRLAQLKVLNIVSGRNCANTFKACKACDIFMLQYTSGSTTEPRGVVVTHSNLIANAIAVVDHAQPITACWLPQHHDMGLIGYYINILLAGGRTLGFAPTSFIKRPALWFEMITRYRVTASSIPNFALELCLNDLRIPQQMLGDFDLSTLRFLMVAAEPINPRHFSAFWEKFRVCGLKKESLFVAYGLAEFTLAVSNYGRRGVFLERDALESGRVSITAANAAENNVELMSCGTILHGTEVVIVNPDNHQPVNPGETGEVWLSGASKTAGYWNNPALTASTFNAQLDTNGSKTSGYLRTGDIGFLDDGELFICGRIKDTLIIHGRNLYPQDIEQAVQQASSAIRKNSVIAFVPSGADTINVLAELTRITVTPDPLEIIEYVRTALQIPVTHVFFLPPRTIARTSSGKVRRAKTIQLFEQGKLPVVAQNKETSPGHQPIIEAIVDELQPIKAKYQLSGNEDFTLFDAGLDSLDLVTLLHWIKEMLCTKGAVVLSKRINVRLFGILTVRQLFELGQQLKANPLGASDELTDIIHQALERRLTEDRRLMQQDKIYRPTRVNAAPDIADKNTSSNNILLTGGTGFLGPFLLHSLLLQSDAIIHVLVRDENQQQAEQRLRQIVETTIGRAADMVAYETRVRVICGDLTQPQFGLSEEHWQQLAREITTIYHNAALVNYLLDYQRMKSANVDGTAHVIDLALGGRAKALNHISTTFIFGWATKDVLHESDRNAAMEHLDFGYSQSKWVSEQLVYSAMEQGLNARIFRPALITPALDGRGGNLDITIRLLTFMIQHGIAVDTQNQVSFMPVDITANNIVAIAQQPDSLNRTFHITRDQVETMPQIIDLIKQKTRIPFESYSLQDFVPEVIARCTEADLLYLLLDFLVDSVDNIAAMEYKLYDNSGYRQARDKSAFGAADAPISQVVDGILDFLRKKQLMPNDRPH